MLKACQDFQLPEEIFRDGVCRQCFIFFVFSSKMIKDNTKCFWNLDNLLD